MLIGGAEGASWRSSEAQKDLHEVAGHTKSGLQGLINVSNWDRDGSVSEKGFVMPCTFSWCFGFGFSTQGKRSAREGNRRSRARFRGSLGPRAGGSEGVPEVKKPWRA